MVHFDNIVEAFFDGAFERYINEKMFYRDYAFPVDDIRIYAEKIVATPMASFISYIRECCTVPFLEYNDIVQFSSLEDATVGIVKILDENGDEGFPFIELGKMLLNDGKERKDGAYRKYGENHTKTAKEFGLTQVLYCKTYLSCMGKALLSLQKVEQDKLLRRLILRNKYIKLLVKLSSSEQLHLDSQMGLLSETTRVRRLSNVRKIWQLIIAEDDITQNLLSNVLA